MAKKLDILTPDQARAGLVIGIEEVSDATVFLLYHKWGGHRTLLRTYPGLMILKDTILEDAEGYQTLYQRGYEDRREDEGQE